ncbi:hypothetical protein E6H36_03880 [Candidatus Bathyarchaeota archaeon]|nr:MAG: hypothetical protein E6H36_03880 [Candidatus Bathyarchaeota archaeon]TMI30847.1 MAG: hypothetical protein E6H29_07440 [Candidatus Bathyarchaeota archaeon]
MQTHQHDVIYFGVVNLVEKNKIIGTIDVWRCRGCNDLFCEDKRFGATDLAPEVGFPKADFGSKWAALICTRDTGSNWTLTSAKPGGTIAHSCTPETKLELKVGNDYNLEQGPIGKHRIILIEKFVNTAVDVESGQKHGGTTDAYQALGKPFSLTPPLSAAIAQSSKLQFFNIASAVFILSGFLAAISVYAQTMLMSRIVLTIVTVAGLSAGYLMFRKHPIGPLLGAAGAVTGLVIYNGTVIAANALGITDYILSAALIADLVLARTGRTRINTLRKQAWHPLDMPAYG